MFRPAQRKRRSKLTVGEWDSNKNIISMKFTGKKINHKEEVEGEIYISEKPRKKGGAV